MCNSDLILLENNDNVNNYCNLEVIYVKAYEILWSTSGDYNFIATVEHFKENINMEKVKGFLQAPWKPTVLPARYRHYEAIEHVSDAIKIFESDK